MDNAVRDIALWHPTQSRTVYSQTTRVKDTDRMGDKKEVAPGCATAINVLFLINSSSSSSPFDRVLDKATTLFAESTSWRTGAISGSPLVLDLFVGG